MPPGTEPSDAAVERVVDALLRGAEPIDVGAFTLDPKAAAEKMARFRYADRDRYLLPFVEGCFELGAERVNVYVQGADICVDALGVALEDPTLFLGDPFTPTLSTAGTPVHRARARIGVALHMALGHSGIRRIALSYDTRATRFVGVYAPEAEPELAQAQPEHPGVLRAIIDRPWTSVARMRRGSPDVHHLRRAVQHSWHKVFIDGELASREAREWDYREDGAGEGYAFLAGLTRAGEPASTVQVWSAGVWLDTLELDGVGFQAELRLTGPRYDLSQTRVVRDARVDAAVAAIETARAECLSRLRSEDEAWEPHTRPSTWDVGRTDAVLGRKYRRVPEGRARRRNPVILGFAVAFYAAGVWLAMQGLRGLHGKDAELFNAFHGGFDILLSLVFCGFGSMFGIVGFGAAERVSARFIVYPVLAAFVLAAVLA